MITSLRSLRQATSWMLVFILLLGGAVLLGGCPPEPPPGEGEGEGEGQVEGEGEGQVEGEGEGQVEEGEPLIIPSFAPGLVIKVEEITIPADLRPEVLFRIEDEKGNNVALSELSDARFILGYLEAPDAGSTGRILSYTVEVRSDPDGVPGSGDEITQANYDSARLAGITYNGDATYTYKFNTVLPANYDASAVHQLGGQFRRPFIVDGETYPYNLIERFVPDGSVVKQLPARDIVLTEKCNDCHTRLGLHGGIRREVQLCIMCHSTLSTDPESGNVVDFPVLIHKIHRGASLPSVEAGEPYQIIGFGNSVHDYSEVHFPQDVRNCTKCHDGADDSDVYKTNPTLEGCASCHDRTWFGSQDSLPEGWEMHVGGTHQNSSLCTVCHTPTAPGVAPIVEAHIIPTESDQAPGMLPEILDIQVLQPAKQAGNGQLMVTFVIYDRDGNAIPDLSVLSSLSLNVGWPVPEYQANVRESILGSPNLAANGDGTFTYTFTSTSIPTNTSDTFAIGVEGRRDFTFRGEVFRQGVEDNGLVLFTMDGSEPVPRREIVDEEKCAKCHKEVRMHGETRTGVEHCLLCHRSDMTDISRRPPEALPAESVHFKYMIHKIHTGTDLEGPYTVYGFGGTPHPFNEQVHFPGRRQECSICHVEGSENLPIAEEALPTVIRDANSEIVREILPETAACTACHDAVINVFHAQLQSDLVAGVESCAVCHGPDEAFAVDAVHALEP